MFYSSRMKNSGSSSTKRRNSWAGALERRRLTGKQRRFVQHYTDPESPGFENATKAAELAGYKGKPGGTQLRVQGHENLTNPNIRGEVERVLVRAGATLEKVAEVLRQGMDATRVRVFMKKSGTLAYSKPLVDHAERRLAAETVAKLHGAFPTTRQQERMALLQIQQNLVIVPPAESDPQTEAEKRAELENLRVIDE